VPIDPKHLLVLTTMDSDRYEEYIAETIMVNEAGSGGRTSAEAQEDIIHRKALKLGAVGQSVGYFYKDNEHVYSSEGEILPGISPKLFSRLSENGPNSGFATDGVHVYDGDGAAIPGADPKTFVATSLATAKDAHHTYDWSNDELKIDGLATRK